MVDIVDFAVVGTVVVDIDIVDIGIVNIVAVSIVIAAVDTTEIKVYTVTEIDCDALARKNSAEYIQFDDYFAQKSYIF